MPENKKDIIFSMTVFRLLVRGFKKKKKNGSGGWNIKVGKAWITSEVFASCVKC